MPAGADRQGRLVVGGEEVAHHEHHGAAAQEPCHVAQRQRDVGPAAAGPERERLRDQPQAVLAPAARRHESLDPIGEEEQSGPVAVLQRAEDEQRGDLRGHFRLRLRREPGRLRGAAVDRDERGQLALLDEDLHERLADACRHVPVDGADLVARLVRPDLAERHPASLEHRVVPARQGVEHGPAGGDLDAPDLPDQLCWRSHQGTSIFSRIRWTIFSEVRFSASAS